MESPRKQCILIVDDDSAVQVSLALLLKQAGYHTVCSDDPAQALSALGREPVDLVLQDMNFSLHTSGADDGMGFDRPGRARHAGRRRQFFHQAVG